MTGALPIPKYSGIIVKSNGYVISGKGMGSVYGGKWRPHPDKPEDNRFLGEPGEVKETVAKGGYNRSTKIGDDGRAVKERHWTDHNRAHTRHTNPHDHIINWDPNRGNPNFVKPHINYPDGAPEFKNFKEIILMSEITGTNSLEANRFKSISEFKWCIRYGGEIEFIWNDKKFNITCDEMCVLGISEANKPETEKTCEDADDVLEYVIDGVRLREIITKVEVTDRTI
ncbi:MAG: hypothetical protein FWG69_05975 [Oscillospiraceae bacterium]|nr:hypothetical protein [Oscillospiraceae bacterium]